MNTQDLAQPVGSTLIATRSPGRTLLDRVTFRLLILSVMVTEGCASLGIHDTTSLLAPRFHRSEIVGLLAGFGTTFAGLPDLITMFKQRSHLSINPRMAAIMAVFQVLWIYYGLLIVSRPVVVWNVLGVVINSVIVAAYFRLRRAAGRAKRASV